MPYQKAKEMRNCVNHIERKIVEETNELSSFLNERKLDLMRYIKCCFEESHNDEELNEMVEDELGHPCSYFDDQKGTPEEQQSYEKICNDYCDNVHSEIAGIETFEEAIDCEYLVERDKEYAHFIREGAEIEILLKKLDSFLIKTF